MNDSDECVNSRFTSILKLDRPLSPQNVNTLRTDRTFWDKEGAVALVQYLFLEDIWKNFFKCLANNISKPMRTNEEASELSNLEEKRDKLAREHYIIRKKNMRATAQIDNLQQNFQSYHDKQNQTASEVYKFAEKMRKEHLALKQETSAKIEATKNSIDEQRKSNEKMLKELKALQTEVGSLSEKFNKQDLGELDRKIDLLLSRGRLSNIDQSSY